MRLKSNDPCWCGSGRKFKRCHKVSPGAPAQAPRRTGSAAGARVTSVAAAPAPARSVPAGIGRPEYAESGVPSPRLGEPPIVTAEAADRLRRAGRAAQSVLAMLGEHVAAGVTTDELDALAHEAIVALGAYPSPLNYHGFPKSICTSVNEVICHGIPDERALAEGDIVNCDVTLYLDGVHGDTSAMFAVGAVDEASRRLVEVTRDCLMLGIEAVRPGGMVRDIGRAIERHASRHGFGIVRAFVGHGIGEHFHTAPHVPHYYDPEATTELRPGMVFTVEPMINAGDWRHDLLDDGWTAVTVDGSRSAQFEHTVLVTARGVEILTWPDGEPQPFPH